MIVGRFAISNNAPGQRIDMWAKPVQGGFILYLLNGGRWVPLKIVDDKNSSSTADDAVAQYDEAGAAEAVQEAIVGTDQDTKDDMTLYGLKAYIDDAIAGLE